MSLILHIELDDVYGLKLRLMTIQLQKRDCSDHHFYVETNQIATLLGRILLGIWSLRSLLKTVGFAEKNFSHQQNGNSENGRVGILRREKCQKKTHSENGRVGRLRREKCQKKTHSENGRVGRLCKEKCQKNGNPQKWEFECCFFSRANWSHCNTMYYCYVNPKRKVSAKYHCLFECFWKHFIHETQCSLQSFKNQPASGADGFRSIGSLPFSEQPKRIRQKSLGFLPKTEWPKEWHFKKAIWSLRSLSLSVEGYQKNGILSSTDSTVFRRCPKEYALNRFNRILYFVYIM